jgi:hypothetical protein
VLFATFITFLSYTETKAFYQIQLMKKNRFIALFLMFVLSGCQSKFGPSALQNTHSAYNQAIVTTLNEQMLLNLVRMKYRDKPFFLKIGSVTASMSFGGTVGVNSEIDLGPDGNVIEPNFGISYADKPTISYTPLQGEDFLKSVLSAIPLQAILVMTQSGWSVERIFGICLERVNDLYNSPRASGPTPDGEPEFRKFKRMLELFRTMQLNGDMEIGPDLSLDTSNPDLVILFELSRVNQDTIDEISKLLEYSDELKPDSQTDKKTHKKTYKVRINNDFVNSRPGELNVRTRSISSVMYYLSQNIKIPEKHIDAGLVTITKTLDGKGIFDWGETPAGAMFQTNFSKEYPENAFIAVPYRDYWYYITDNDLQSKSTFMLLTQLFDLQAGQSEYSGPTLTLPVR